MHIKNSRYYLGGMYDFEVEDLNDIINDFEEAKDRLENFIEEMDNSVATELKNLGESETKNTIEEVYRVNIENAEIIKDMCIEGADGVRNFIDSIEDEIGLIFDITKFDPDDVRKGVTKINNRVTTAVNSINSKCTLPSVNTPAVGKKDEKKEEIRKHNKHVYQNLTDDLLVENRRIIDLVEELTVIGRTFDNLDGNWTRILGNAVAIDRLEYTDFRKFSEDVKSQNKILSNSDLRTSKEIKQDEAKSKFLHKALGAVEFSAAVVSIAFPPVGIIAVGAGVLNGAVYALEGELGEGLVSAVMAIPVFEGARIASNVVGKGVTKVASKVATKGSKVGSTAGEEVVESIVKADDIMPEKITSKEIAESLPISKVEVWIKTEASKNLFKATDGQFDEMIKHCDMVNDLAVKPVFSIFYNWQDGGYSSEEAQSDALNTIITFYKTISDNIRVR